MSAVEDVATAIAESACKHNLVADQQGRFLFVTGNNVYMRLGCQDASQAKRLAEMMSGPPPRSVFDAMGIDPVDPLERFPSIRGKV
jgi:hypothetical protein